MYRANTPASFKDERGLRPRTPEVYRFSFQEGGDAAQKKKAAKAALPQTRYGAQVAPQRCPILRIGKAYSVCQTRSKLYCVARELEIFPILA